MTTSSHSIKRADTLPGVLDAIAARWSPRAFSPDSVPTEALERAFDAARWAASCFNEQPWRFVVARREDADAFARLLSCLAPKNQEWALAAGAVGLAFAQEHFSANGKPNAHAWHDVGLALGQLSVQAASEGLMVHLMAGIDRERCVEVAGPPEGVVPVCGFALGYAGSPDAISDEGLRKAETTPRQRKPLADVLTWGARF